jgi:hypothetical protein
LIADACLTVVARKRKFERARNGWKCLHKKTYRLFQFGW